MISGGYKERKILVEFQNVSIGDGTARIGFKTVRGSTPLTVFDEWFCERRLTGEIQVTAGGSDPDQKPLIDDAHEPVEIDSVFDVKGYAVKSKVIAAGLTFALREIDSSLLAKFAKRSGYLIITEVGHIPENDKEPSDVDVEPSLFLKTADDESDDAWKGAPVLELGLTKGVIAKLKSLNVETIGELEDLRAGTVKGYRRGLLDVDGIGQAAVDKIEDRVLAWLNTNRDKLGTVAVEPSSDTPPQPDQIKLKRSVRGYANKASGLYKDAVFDVETWLKSGDPKIRTTDGQLVRLESRDWQPAKLI